MRFILVIDDNGPEFTEQDPVDQVVCMLETAKARLREGDRGGGFVVNPGLADSRLVGGFELHPGQTEGRPGWERTR